MAVKKFFQKAELKCGRIVALFPLSKREGSKAIIHSLATWKKYIRENLDRVLSHTVLKVFLINLKVIYLWIKIASKTEFLLIREVIIDKKKESCDPRV